MSSPAPRLRMFAGPNGSDKRSLNLLNDAVACAYRAYIFDNSGHERIWVAEASRGIELEMKSAQMPNWFKTHLWDPWDSSESPA